MSAMGVFFLPPRSSHSHSWHVGWIAAQNTYRRGLTGSLSLETRKFEVLTREDKRKSIAPTSFLVGYFVRKRIEYEKELNVYYARWKNVGNDDYSNSSYGGK